MPLDPKVPGKTQYPRSKMTIFKVSGESENSDSGDVWAVSGLQFQDFRRAAAQKKIRE